MSCQLIVEVGEWHDALEARISASEVDLCPLDLEYSIKATLRRFSLAHLFAEWKQNQKKKVLIQCEPKLRGKERYIPNLISFPSFLPPFVLLLLF